MEAAPPAPVLAWRFRQTARLLAVLVLILGSAGFLCWLFDVSGLRPPPPGHFPTRPLAATGLMLAGAATWLRIGARPWSRIVATTIALVMTVLGAAILLEYAWRIHLGLETVVRSIEGDAGARTLSAGATPTTAACLILAGLALLHTGQRRPWIRTVLVAVIATIGLAGTVGYVIGIEAVDDEVGFALTTFSTSLGLFALGSALLLMDPMRGLVALAASPGAGGYLLRRLVPASILVPLGMGALAQIGQQAGLYTTGIRLALVVVASMIGLLVVAVASGRSLHTSEHKRRAAERRLGDREQELAVALARERSARAEADRESHVNATLNRLGLSFVREHDEEALVQRITDATRELIGAHIGAYFVPDASAGDDRFTPYALSGIAREAFRGTSSFGVTPLLAPIHRGEAAVRRDDVRADPLYEGRLPPGHPPVVSFLGVPVVTAGGQVLGALFFGHPERARFSSEDQQLVEGVAGQAAIALENARLYRALRESEALARDAATRAQEADRRKDEFLAMLGHELRNPLSPILTALELLRLSGKDAELEWQVIDRQARHLSHLVDDLFDVSRMAAGRVELHRSPVEVAHIVGHAVEMAAPLIEGRAHHLTVSVPEKGLLIDADERRMTQVVSNLLTNAARYTPPGGRISVCAEANEDTMVLRVRDTGVGMAPEVLALAFDPFAQAPRPVDRAEGGLGLGLTIVRSLVGLHDGTVRAQSEGPGQGSELIVELPLSSRTSKPLRPSQAPPAVAVQPVHRLLVVDDNQDAAFVLASILRHRGHTVRVAHDGPAALAVIDDFEPDVALLDIGLPVMDGYQLADRIRAHPNGRRTRFVAVTGYGQQSTRRQSLEHGFALHLVKPIQVADLETFLLELYNPPARNGNGPATARG